MWVITLLVDCIKNEIGVWVNVWIYFSSRWGCLLQGAELWLAAVDVVPASQRVTTHPLGKNPQWQYKNKTFYSFTRSCIISKVGAHYMVITLKCVYSEYTIWYLNCHTKYDFVQQVKQDLEETTLPVSQPTKCKKQRLENACSKTKCR